MSKTQVMIGTKREVGEVFTWSNLTWKVLAIRPHTLRPGLFVIKAKIISK